MAKKPTKKLQYYQKIQRQMALGNKQKAHHLTKDYRQRVRLNEKAKTLGTPAVLSGPTAATTPATPFPGSSAVKNMNEKTPAGGGQQSTEALQSQLASRLTGQALAVTRGRGKKIGLRRNLGA